MSPPPAGRCGLPDVCPKGEPPQEKAPQGPGRRRREGHAERDHRLKGRKRKARGAGDAVLHPKWSWIKGNRVEGEVFAFDALRCDNSHALARY